jgi:hypothetical protein
LRFWTIKTIRHKGLKRLFEQDDPRGVNPEHADELRDILRIPGHVNNDSGVM